MRERVVVVVVWWWEVVKGEGAGCGVGCSWLLGCKGESEVVIRGEGDGPVVGWLSSGVREHGQGRSWWLSVVWRSP
jgi:hypothetical protein